MKDRFFLDTNIFVYSFDATHPEKQGSAQDWISRALKDRKGVISSQVVQEFLNVATRKFTSPMSPAECRSYLSLVLMPLCQSFAGVTLFQQAVDIRERFGFSFYDSLIVSAAWELDCDRIITEDLSHGQKIGNLVIENPFK